MTAAYISFFNKSSFYVPTFFAFLRAALCRSVIKLSDSGCKFEICVVSLRKRSGMEMNMRLAVTYENGKIFQHFVYTEQFKVYDVEDGQIQKEEIVNTNGNGHGALSGFLTELGVDTLLCGGSGYSVPVMHISTMQGKDLG